MKGLTRLAVSAALTVAAFGAQAAVLEIDYPGDTVATAAHVFYRPAAAPFLIQSNYEGPRIDPAYAENALPRPALPAVREIAKPWGPGHNA